MNNGACRVEPRTRPHLRRQDHRRGDRRGRGAHDGQPRVLNSPERVSAETAERVRAAIERLGYVPNLIAGGLSSRRSRMIAAIVPTISSPMFNAPVQSFVAVLGRAGYHVMLSLSGYDLDADAEDALVRAVLARRPDGLLLTGAHRPPGVRKLLADAGVPVVEIWDRADAPTDILVGFDHAEVGAAVADHFAGLGHTRFAMFAAGDMRARQRHDGFARRVAEHGGSLVASRTLPAPSGIADGRAALAGSIPQLGQRTALFASSDLVAYGAMVEARRHGIDIPGRLAVCGFGDFEIGRSTLPAITTVRVDGELMGRLAAEQLLARLNGTAQPAPAPILVPFRIVARDTT